MLVLTRKKRQEIRIGDSITITILQVKGSNVRVGVEAPDDVRIVRGELSIDSEAPLAETASKAVAAIEKHVSVSSSEADHISTRNSDRPKKANPGKLPPLANHMRLPSQGLGFSSVR